MVPPRIKRQPEAILIENMGSQVVFDEHTDVSCGPALYINLGYHVLLDLVICARKHTVIARKPACTLLQYRLQYAPATMLWIQEKG